MIEKYINREQIIEKLVSMRCAMANARQKCATLHSIVINSRGKKPDRHEASDRDVVYSLFPPRKDWAGLSYGKRKGRDQVSRNRMMLSYTVRMASRLPEKPGWYTRLLEFADSVISMALSDTLRFHKPKVAAIFKKAEDSAVVCRPICDITDLKEKLVATLYNKLITRVFDDYFYDGSYAFRAPRQKEDGSPDNDFQHLAAVERIKEFRRAHKGTLYVAECDMRSFYDTISHDVIKRRFLDMLTRSLNDGRVGRDEFRTIRRVFFRYVDSFNFYDDVLKYNRLQADGIWNSVRKKYPGKEYTFRWVGHHDVRTMYGCTERSVRKVYRKMGVPQGGALSGFIANCMMDYVDQKLRPYWDGNPDFCYVRFCDDMIMVSSDKARLTEAFGVYKDAIRDSRLFAHKDERMPARHCKSFWDGKTRGPYAWGGMADGVFPWITFVGYDINSDGDTRIRRKTYKKECAKQYEKLHEVERVLRNPRLRHTVPYIIQSLMKRLVGMSVGRFSLHEAQQADNFLSWAQAFKSLTYNRWSVAQLKGLDRHRNHIIHRFMDFLRDNNDRFDLSNVVKSRKKRHRRTQEELRKQAIEDIKRREAAGEKVSFFHKLLVMSGSVKFIDIPKRHYFGAPFSYYYQVLKGSGIQL